MDNVEIANSSLEGAHQEHAPMGKTEQKKTRLAAVLVACFAAIAVLVEMGVNDAQTDFLAHHIAASDTWTQYQAKSDRSVTYAQSANIMLGQSVSAEEQAAQQQRIADAKAQAARMRSDPAKGDGMEQLQVKAHKEIEERDAALKKRDWLEYGVRGLQMSVVILGLFLVTRFVWILGVGFVLGTVSALYALLPVIKALLS